MPKVRQKYSKKGFYHMDDMAIKQLRNLYGGFQKLYQQHASGLMKMNSSAIIPPGHPLFSEKNSIESLKAENDKLLKQNLELKKKIEKENAN